MSGGLDSTLAVRLIVEQGIEVVALNYKSPFCLCDGSSSGGCKSHAKVAAEQTGIEIKTIHKGLDYLDVVRSPKFGYGSAMNPCVDCRVFTFKSAKKYMEETGASFIITGEVLGQRPMSQRRDPMFLIERESGLDGLILRPLSAKLLPPTEPEKAGIVDREKLLAISGRSRKDQIRIADEFEVEDYPCASGGCLLTDKNFGAKLKDSFDHKESLGWGDIKLLTLGRHFRINDEVAAVVGRNEDENRRIELLGKNGFLFTPKNFKGPSLYMGGRFSDDAAEIAGGLILRFSKVNGGKDLTVNYANGSKNGSFIAEKRLSEDEVDRMWIRSHDGRKRQI